MKLCKDCKHMEEVGLGCGLPPICVHPGATLDPVYGQEKPTCSLMRSPYCTIEHCGPEGNWFEEKAAPEAVGKAEMTSISKSESITIPANTLGPNGSITIYPRGKPTLRERIASYFRWIYQR